jgi:hypothetical protein
MRYEYTDERVTPLGGIQEMKGLLDKTGISKKLASPGLPEGTSIIESTPLVLWKIFG